MLTVVTVTIVLLGGLFGTTAVGQEIPVNAEQWNALDLGACTVGMTVRPGQSCTFSGGTFSVRKSDGFGCVNDSICSGSRVTIDTFSASRIDDSNDWRIDSL